MIAGWTFFYLEITLHVVFDLISMLDFTDQAKVVLYKGEVPVKEMKFNAKDSDNEHWFAFDRMKGKLPWTDMDSQPMNIFAMKSDYDRSYHINSEYGGCPYDIGWMVICGGGCPWEQHFGQDAILYSKLDVRTNWNHYGK